MRELFGKAGENVWLQPPFYCDYGSNIELGERNHVQVEYWREFSAAHGVAFVDLYALFIPEPDADAIVDVGDPAGLFIEGDVHWNAQGHRAVADALEPVVRDSLPLPDSTSS